MELNRGKLRIMLQRIKNKYIDFSFEIGIVVKGVFAIFETIGSFVVLFITPHFIRRAVAVFTREELTEDPTDFISHYLLQLANSFSVKAQMFAFIYLFVHGVIKLFLIGALLKKKLWAYPASIIVFTLFILYQIYRYFHTYSVWLIVLTVFDVIVVWLIWREYKLVKERLSVAEAMAKAVKTEK